MTGSVSFRGYAKIKYHEWHECMSGCILTVKVRYWVGDKSYRFSFNLHESSREREWKDEYRLMLEILGDEAKLMKRIQNRVKNNYLSRIEDKEDANELTRLQRELAGAVQKLNKNKIQFEFTHEYSEEQI